jgi:histone-lysine N-methyltransferase SETD7
MAAKRRKLQENLGAAYSFDEDTESEDEEEFSYIGSKNLSGLPHGRGTMTWLPSGNRFEGHFSHGVREGKGCFYFADGSSLSGIFKEGYLEGIGTFIYPEGSFLKGVYVEGDLNGYCKEYDSDHRLTFEGHYKNNVRCGFVKIYDEFGGSLLGNVDKSGSLTGKRSIAYLYPDGVTALIGAFSGGKMVSAQPAHLKDVVGDCFPDAEVVGRPLYESVGYDESTNNTISTLPLVPDLYEQNRVYVAPSLLPNAGEGLFARRTLSLGEVVSFYNGVRITHSEVDNRDWVLNSNTLSLDESTVIDVPDEYSSVSKYCASLGHKANHSFDANCEYSPFHHPRFGHIKCIRTLCCVNEGEELTCNYGYDHKFPDTNKSDLPVWYKNHKMNATFNDR